MNYWLNDVSLNGMVFLHAGIWRLKKIFSMNEAENIVFRGEPGTVISGAVPLNAKWQSAGNGIFMTRLDCNIDCLLVNGQYMRMARYPKFSGTAIPAADNCLDPIRTACWKNPENAYFHTLHHAKWGSLHYRCTGRKADGSLDWQGGWQVNRYSEPHKQSGYVENVFEELSEPGEWYMAYRTHELYLIPPAGVDLETADIETVSMESLIHLYSCRNIKFWNISFMNTARTFMKTDEPLLRSDWKIHRDGAVFAEDSKQIEFVNCDFNQLGGNAVFFSGNCRNCRIESTHIHDCGASGVVFCGKPDSVRSPLFEYEERQNDNDISRTPGPAEQHYPKNCSVHDCLIHNTGTVEKQSAGVQIETASCITVSNCSVYHVPRAAVNIGSGCFGGHVIRDCDLFDTVLETGDHGSFNSWGRDRFWELNGFDVNGKNAVKTALLDCTKKTVLKHNRIRCDHGWAVDLDDGSSNYLIQNNLLLAGGLKFREGFCRTAENNIIIGNGLHLHVWFRYSKDTVKNNIFCREYRPIRMPEKPWGDQFDCNFLCRFNEPAGPAELLMQMSGGDARSLQGDPEFLDGFTLPETSPALKTGFKPFPVKKFGVISPHLKEIAEQPQIPVLQKTDRPETVQEAKTFSFGTVRNISGLGDQSAFGLPSPDGVLVIESPYFQKNDVIVAIGDTSVRSVQDLGPLQARNGASVRIIRDQHPVILTMPGD